MREGKSGVVFCNDNSVHAPAVNGRIRIGVFELLLEDADHAGFTLSDATAMLNEFQCMVITGI
jgi:hypothetical protein